MAKLILSFNVISREKVCFPEVETDGARKTEFRIFRVNPLHLIIIAYSGRYFFEFPLAESFGEFNKDDYWNMNCPSAKVDFPVQGPPAMAMFVFMASPFGFVGTESPVSV